LTVDEFGGVSVNPEQPDPRIWPVGQAIIEGLGDGWVNPNGFTLRNVTSAVLAAADAVDPVRAQLAEATRKAENWHSDLRASLKMRDEDRRKLEAQLAEAHADLAQARAELEGTDFLGDELAKAGAERDAAVAALNRLAQQIVDTHVLRSDHYESLDADVVTCAVCCTPEDDYPCAELIAARAALSGGDPK
jgi:hypothetical protein